jgi:hypothetical protein
VFSVDDIYAYACIETLRPVEQAENWLQRWLRFMRVVMLVFFAMSLQCLLSGLVATGSLTRTMDSPTFNREAQALQAQMFGGPLPPGEDPVKPDLARLNVLRNACIALATIVLAISVHREMNKATALARIAMSHVRCLPAIFQPLYLRFKPIGSADQASHPDNALTRFWLLLLPWMQLWSSLCVLLAASTAFSVSANVTEPVSIIYNAGKAWSGGFCLGTLLAARTYGLLNASFPPPPPPPPGSCSTLRP